METMVDKVGKIEEVIRKYSLEFEFIPTCLYGIKVVRLKTKSLPVWSGIDYALAEKIAAKYWVTFEPGRCSGKNVRTPIFYSICTSEEELEPEAVKLKQAENEFKLRCEKLAECVMKL